MSIYVENYHKVYGTTVAVAGLTFRVDPGEILALVGPNGAGKTTTLRALAGILTPTYGRLFIAGHDVVREPVLAKAALAYVPDDPQLFDRLTVWEHFQFIASVYRLSNWEDHAEQLLQRLELTEKRKALASELSRGMKQKLAIGCADLHRPKAILLDEPLTGLDPRGIRTMKTLMRQQAEQGAAMIVSSHLLSLFEDLCSSVLILHHGQLVRNGRLSELRAEVSASGKVETLEELFFRLTGTSPDEAETVLSALEEPPTGNPS